MEIYQSQSKEIPGDSFKDVEKIAKTQFKLIKKNKYLDIWPRLNIFFTLFLKA